MTLRALAWVGLGLALGVAAQQPSDLVKPRVAGQALASQFGKWTMMADGPVLAKGQPETATLESSAFTLPDGTAFQPLQAGTPVAIGGDGSPETVIPTSVSCGVGGPRCTFAAVFAHPHPGHFRVSSGTGGLQEAINYEAAHGGGMVLVDPEWGGGPLAGLLGSLKLPSTVLMIDETAGNWVPYGLGNGGAPQALGGFSSASGGGGGGGTGGATVFASVNGAVFASGAKFSPPTPGVNLSAGVAATVTPAWTLPKGVEADDTVYLSGGTGAAEVVTLTNVGAACPAGAANSVCFTPANSHSGAWTLASATSGLEEAVNTAGAGGWVMDDLGAADIRTPLVIPYTLRLTGFNSSLSHSIVATEIVQLTPNTDVIQLGRPGGDAQAAQDVVIEHLTAKGVAGDGTDSGVAVHCLNCSRIELDDVKGTNAHDGVFFDSANNQAFVATVINCHFLGNYNGVHLVGGSANRLTFTGDTVDGNQYGVFDDGGWVHTWIGNDIEANARYGYWQQVSHSGAYSGHNVVLHGNYFEANGASAGQGDVFLGQLVGGGSGNNGAGCINCEVTDNIFNATVGGNVTALNLGAVMMTVSNNTYSGYGAGKEYAYITGPDPNFSRVLMLGDCGTVTPPGCTESAPGTITRLDPNGTLTIGGTDQLTDQFGTRLHDTTIESPSGAVSIRGKQGGVAPVNQALLQLDGNSSTVKFDEIKWRNQGVDEWGIKNDVSGANAHDYCLANDYANPANATCDLYLNQQKHFQFSAAGVPGNITFDADYRFKQQANGDPAIQVMRATDTSPTGYLLDLEDSTESTPLFRVDATGAVVAGRWNNATSAMTVGAVTANSLNVIGSTTLAGLHDTGGATVDGASQFNNAISGTSASLTGAMSAASATISGVATLGAGSTVGGQAINTDGHIIHGQSGTMLSGTYGSVASGSSQCATGGISFSSGVAVGMAVASNPETTPPSGLIWTAAIDAANHVTIEVCNVTNATITWSSGSIWDVRVIP